MKLNVLDAHDRLKQLKKQDFSIGECCQDLINQRPFGDYPFYIFAHTRTEDDGVNKRLIWQPRLTKPEAQSNSMLFKAYPGSEEIKVIWILPAEELWAQYEKGLVTENQTVVESIYNFRYHKKKMEAREHDDLEDYRIKDIYSEIARNSQVKKKIIL